MPSLEQIIRPFVVDPTTPPVPYITTENDPTPDLVRINIGIGGTRLSDLSSNVAPIVPPPANEPTTKTKPPTIVYKTLTSSHSMSVQCYMTGVVQESTGGGADDPFGIWDSPFSSGGNPFGIGEGLP